MAYKEQTTFTINQNLVLSKIKYSDELYEQAEYEDSEKAFESTFLLIVEELSSLINDFIGGLND